MLHCSYVLISLQQKEKPGVKIGLIPCEVGGTSVRSWQPGGYDSAMKRYPYDDAAARIKVAMKSGTINGMVWHQGESDSKPIRLFFTYLS